MPKRLGAGLFDPAVVERLEMEECPWMWFGEELMCPHCGGLSPNYFVHRLNHWVGPYGTCRRIWAPRLRAETVQKLERARK